MTVIRPEKITPPTDLVHSLLPHLNTEAKCAVALAVPSGTAFTPLDDIRLGFQQLGVFSGLERGRDRFNVFEIMKHMGGSILELCLDESHHGFKGSATAVRQAADPIETTATALAGSLLGVSSSYRVSLRGILGERKVTSIDGLDSVNVRFSVLNALSKYHPKDGVESFTRSAIKEYVAAELPDVHDDVINRHIRRLEHAGMIRCTRKDLSFTQLPTGPSSASAISAVVTAVNNIAAGSLKEIRDGKRRGSLLIQNGFVLPTLVRRSFKSTNHTNKSSVRRAKTVKTQHATAS